jgi:hypothetical protein
MKGKWFSIPASAALATCALATCAFAVCVLAVSCIEPLELTPDIAGDILAFEVEGQTRSSVNTAARTVTLEVEEGIDLAAVRVTRVELVETATSDIGPGSVVDISVPLRIVVTTAASYEWTVSATVRHDDRRQLPGGDFDGWHRADLQGVPTANGKVWNPWPAGGVWEQQRWWDTGNSGVALLGDSNSTPTEPGEGSPANPEGRAARLMSRWAGIKAAGGNIYFGRFGKFTGIDATCLMGHPWQAKPARLKGWYKYFPQPVDRVSDQHLALHPFKLTREQWMGSPDSLHVSIALWASPDGADIPFTVDTNPGTFLDFTRQSEGVIAWGSFISAVEQASWAEFDLPLEYFTDAPLPANTYLIVQATPSKNCNYFIAGCSGGGPDGREGSLMYVDEFELVYD